MAPRTRIKIEFPQRAEQIMRRSNFIRKTVLLVVVGIWIIKGGGCMSPAVSPVEGPVIVSGDVDEIWQACQDQVKGRGFRLDLVDRREGIIISYPQVSSQWFEFWCQDVVTSEDLVESSLHTVRRIIQIEMDDLGDQSYGLYCRAFVERLWRGTEIVGGRVRAREILGKSVGRIPVYGSGSPVEAIAEVWLPVGEDHALESSILQSISGTLAKRP
ncbi:MAG: hypothetical protein GY869_17280 [Planctomycetes bacterium]|nr:hypothetical protein [Planctomycetota bacterium]